MISYLNIYLIFLVIILSFIDISLRRYQSSKSKISDVIQDIEDISFWNFSETSTSEYAPVATASVEDPMK